MSRSKGLSGLLAGLGLAAAACGGGASEPPDAAPPGPDAGPPGTFELVGHHDLGARGTNAALAVAGDHVYVGSRADGSRPRAGVMIVDVSDPAAPQLVGELGPPEQGLIGLSSRELRAVDDLNLLIVLDISCDPLLHGCSRDLAQFPMTNGVAETDRLKIYDISDRAAPVLAATWDFGTFPGLDGSRPHEFFLWRDPAQPSRVLLFVATPSAAPNLTVVDATDLANLRVAGTFDLELDGLNRNLEDLHSVSVSDDGAIGYLAYQQAGFFMVDTSAVAAGVEPATIDPITPVAARVDYAPPEPAGPHSALPIPGRDLVILTDEVYNPPYSAGCPWGWVRLVDVSNPAAPAVVGEHKEPENDAASCPPQDEDAVVYTAHNPTVTANLALVTWHAAGLLALDTSDPARPRLLARFLPEPLAEVALEDRGLGGRPVILWSYPVIKDGLIYVVDVRNGLYILRYHGPFEEEIAAIDFAEGNSNL